MSVSVTMPQLGESVTEGTVTRWLKQVGDTVTADEPLLEISTDKVDTEIPAPVSGVLLEIRVLEDGVVQVGAELAVIGAANEAAPAAPAQPDAPVVAAIPEPVVAPVPAPAPVVAAPVAAPAAAQTGATVDVTLPQLGESVTEGTVTRWLKQVGETVTADEPLVEISTDKVDTELPAPASGVLLSINVPEDSTTEVGSILGVIGVGASAAPVAAAPVTEAPVAVAPAAPVVAAPVAAPVVAAPIAAAPVAPTPVAALVAPRTIDDDSYVTPLVRRLAVQSGVDLSTVIGTGVGGRIRKQDVAAAAEAKAAAAPAAVVAPTQTQTAPAASVPVAVSPLRGRTEPLSRLRKVIAERMVESLQISAQLTSVVEVDVTRIANLRNKVKGDFEAREGVKLTFLPFIGKAAVEALKQFPMVNASIDMAASTITYHDTENLGIAVDTDRGLLVPVIRNAGDLNIAGLSRSISDIADRTRSSKVLPDELSGGTFTITNTGSRGSLFDTPIVNQPQVAILGTGAIEKRPVVVPDSTGQDVIAIRSMMYLALSYDHRVVDGADAARFLVAMKNRLEEGSFEAELGL